MRRPVIRSERSRSFANTPLFCRRGTRCLPGPGQLQVPGSAGKSDTGSLLRDPLAGGVDVRVQLGLTRVGEQNHSFTSCGMCVLRCFVQGSAGLSSPAPSPAVAGSSPTASSRCPSPQQHVRRLRPSRCPPARQRSATVVIVSCIGCPRRHHAGGSGSSPSTLRSMASTS